MLFSRENYKDNYFKNLSFVKQMANEISGVPALKKQRVSNLELLRIITKDGYPSPNNEMSLWEIKSILREVNDFLMEFAGVTNAHSIDTMHRGEECVTYMLNAFLQGNNNVFRPLSACQIRASLSMQHFVSIGEYNRALHDLANCINDEGKALNSNKWISNNEFALYANMVQSFINHIENVNVEG